MLREDIPTRPTAGHWSCLPALMFAFVARLLLRIRASWKALVDRVFVEFAAQGAHSYYIGAAAAGSTGLPPMAGTRVEAEVSTRQHD